MSFQGLGRALHSATNLKKFSARGKIIIAHKCQQHTSSQVTTLNMVPRFFYVKLK